MGEITENTTVVDLGKVITVMVVENPEATKMMVMTTILLTKMMKADTRKLWVVERSGCDPLGKNMKS